jgi:hypothetical protein
VDPVFEAHELFHANMPAVFAIRPDRFIGLWQHGLQLDGIQTYFQQNLEI